SQRSMTISDMFTLGRNLAAKRGISGGDSNAMTTTQWGAVAYLTRAMGREPDKNPSEKFITGNGNYITYVNQSTTGNTTGVYDMSGCSWETMSAYVNNGELTDASGKKLKDNRNTKYVDVYAMGNGNQSVLNYEANVDKYGDAKYEVTTNQSTSSSWSKSYSFFPGTYNPVFCQGAHAENIGGFGVFAFASVEGAGYRNNCWRGVCTL
ncbi:MAG: hypothetical protein RSC09_04825, partial [Clostridia bacterium]